MPAVIRNPDDSRRKSTQLLDENVPTKMFRTIVIGLLSTTVAINATQSSSRRLDDTRPIARRDLVRESVHHRPIVETNGESTTAKLDSDETSRRMPVGPSEDIEEQRNVSTMASRGSTDDGTVDRTTDQGRTRLPLCCRYGYRLRRNRCIETNGTFRFPALYHADDLTLIDAAPDHRLGYFHLFVRDPCVDRQRYKLVPDENPNDAFMLLDNGSIYMQNEGNILRETDYCLGIVDTELFDVVLCFDTDEESENKEDVKLTVVFPVGLIVSVPFLFATFIVYTLIPEFGASMHGRTLRGYVGSLVVAYVILAVVQISPQEQISDSLCIAFGTYTRLYARFHRFSSIFIDFHRFSSIYRHHFHRYANYIRVASLKHDYSSFTRYVTAIQCFNVQSF